MKHKSLIEVCTFKLLLNGDYGSSINDYSLSGEANYIKLHKGGYFPNAKFPYRSNMCQMPTGL